MTGRFLEGVTSASAAKVSKAAGLPNLIGDSGTVFSAGNCALLTASGGTGVFKNPYNNGYFQALENSISDLFYNGGNQRIHFDASLCNHIYGNSTTVQPASYTVMYIMKIKA